MPARRLERVAGFLPVVRQDPGFLVQPTRAELGDGTRNGRVDTPAVVRELGVESDLLSERMPEGVLRLGVQRALEDELGPFEAGERGRQVARRQVGDPLEDGPRELLADERSRLKDPPLSFGETVDARGEHGLDGRRNLHRLDRAHQAIVPAATFEDCTLDERSNDLLGEERIPAGAGLDQVRQKRDRGMPSDEVIEELVSGRAAQGPQRDLAIVGLGRPLRAVLGTKVHEHEGPGAPRGFHHLRQEFVAARIDPVRVVDEDQDGFACAARLHQVSHEREELPFPSLGIHARRHAVGIAHAEKLEHQGNDVVEVPTGQRELAGNPAPGLVRAVVLGDAEEVPKQLEQREKRDTLPDGRTVRFGHLDPTCPAASGKLGAKPALFPVPAAATTPTTCPCPDAA